METNNQKNDQNIIPNDADKQQKGVNVPNLRFSDKNVWQRIKLNEYADFLQGLTYSPNNVSTTGRLVLRSSNIQNSKLAFDDNVYVNMNIPAKISTKENDVLMCVRNGSKNLVGKTALITKEFENLAWGAFMNIIRPKDGKTLLFHFLNSQYFKNQIKADLNTATVNQITIGTLNQCKISIPLSEIEKDKLCIFFNLLDQRIDTQSKIIEQYESLIKAISNILISKTNGKVVALSEIAKIYQPETITQSKFNENGKFPVFGANGLIGHYNFYNHENAQICITCRGATCGNVNLSLPKSWITGNSMVINTDECTRINKMYLYYLLKNYNFKSIISGSGQPQIVREPISAIKINLPIIQDQNKIVKILNTYNELLRKEKDILELYKKQKAYLLKNMFI